MVSRKGSVQCATTTPFGRLARFGVEATDADVEFL